MTAPAESQSLLTEESPPPVADAKPNGKAREKEAKKEKREIKDDGDDAPSARPNSSAEIRKLHIAEDATIREVVEALGDEGTFTIKIFRRDPEYTKDAMGKNVLTRGYLETVDRKIDEAWIQQKYGGGTYQLTFRKRGGGYVTHRTITIAGDPDLSALPKAVATTAAVTPPPADSSPLAIQAMGLMSKQLERAEERAERAASGGGNDVVLTMVREQLEAARKEKSELLRELAELRAAISRPPPKSADQEVTSRLLDKMIDQDSARLQQVRMTYDSEIRQLKESHLQDLARIQDRMDREMQQLRNQHERELALVRQSHETSLATLKSSHEVALASAKASFETQAALLQSDNRRLERDNNELRAEVKELRAKKEKSLPEQIKEIKALKDLVTDGDDAEPASAIEKVAEAVTNPETIAAIGSIFKRGQGDQPQQAPAVQQPVARPRRAVVRDQATGQKFIVEGNQIRPAKKMPPPGTPPEVAALPEIDPNDLKMVVGYLENACTAGTDPALVVQSFGAHVPEPIRVAIRDLGGVDQFLIKVAKLPSSSPLLANQAGKNWVRKLGKALAGE